MYDTEESTLRRVVALILWFVVIVVIAWAAIWLVFFRNRPANNTGQLKHSPKTTSQSPPPSTPSTGSSGSGSDNAANSTASNGTGTTSNNLPNTGAGDILLPFAVATGVGTVYYQIRARKKLSA